MYKNKNTIKWTNIKKNDHMLVFLYNKKMYFANTDKKINKKNSKSVTQSYLF